MPNGQCLITDWGINYFDPLISGVSIVGGYQKYDKWHRRDSAFVSLEESTGEYYSDIIKMLNPNNSLIGKDVLEIGCAKGFAVEAMRDAGIKGYGVDISAYAISQARADIQQYLTVADVRTWLPTLKNNAYDFLFSRWWLQCMNDADLPALISQMNRVCKGVQVHMIYMNLSEWYNIKTLEEWRAYDWKPGTRLISMDSMISELIK